MMDLTGFYLRWGFKLVAGGALSWWRTGHHGQVSKHSTSGYPPGQMTKLDIKVRGVPARLLEQVAMERHY